MKNSSYFKTHAKECLKGKWGVAILVSIVTVVISSLLNLIPGVGAIVSLLISAQLSVGCFIVYTKLVRKEETKFTDIFENFQYFLTSFAASMLMSLLIILWFFLLIIPGIIAIYSYSMVFFLKAKNPKMRAYKTVKLSAQIMKGRKWKLFCLECSFIGWILFGIITFGIGLFYVIPYMEATITAFFEDAYNEYFQLNDNSVIE